MSLILSQEQQWLVQATVRKTDEALLPWEKWKSTVDIADIDFDSYRILPHLYRNLSRLAVEESQLARLKGVYRHTWCKNRIAFQKLDTMVRALMAKDIRCLLLGDTAMIPMHYQDYGIQSLDRLDLLVPFAQAETAMECLHELEWTSGIENPNITRANQGATVFIDSDGEQCKLYWHVLPECPQAETSDNLWRHAVPAKLNGLSVYTLAPTDHLLRQLLEKPAIDSNLSLQWMINTMNLACSPKSPIDWHRLMELGRKYDLLLPIKERIMQLATLPEATFPQSVLTSYSKIQFSPLERLAYQAIYHPTTKRDGVLIRLSIHWCQYRRLKGPQNVLQNLMGFAQYLQRSWSIDHLWKVPAYALVRSLRRMWREGLV